MDAAECSVPWCRMLDDMDGRWFLRRERDGTHVCDWELPDGRVFSGGGRTQQEAVEDAVDRERESR